MTIFSLNIFGISIAPTWYGLMYAISFLVGYILIRRQYSPKNTDSILVYTVLGVIIGGRLGYVFFYNFPYFIALPLEVFMPWLGGMSFHGGCIGVILAWILVAKKLRMNFLDLADSLVWIIPIGLFFGRIGNYINGELLGFSGYAGLLAREIDGVLYFPTPLLEAFLEGIVLFLILFFRRQKIRYSGQLGIWFLVWYAIFRFIAEFFRTPDVQIGYLFGGWMTLGQAFSIVMIIIGVAVGCCIRRAKLKPQNPMANDQKNLKSQIKK